MAPNSLATFRFASLTSKPIISRGFLTYHLKHTQIYRSKSSYYYESLSLIFALLIPSHESYKLRALFISLLDHLSVHKALFSFFQATFEDHRRRVWRAPAWYPKPPPMAGQVLSPTLFNAMVDFTRDLSQIEDMRRWCDHTTLALKLRPCPCPC
jgi:hypothetical protein